MASEQETFQRLRSQSPVDVKDLDALWKALDTVQVDSLLGEWKGGDFATGHPASRQLEKSRWFGKTFNSRTDAKPLICRRENGELFSDKETMRGEASLWMVEFRGEVTATMVYDGMPVLDHFKKVDENTLLGVMNGKLPGIEEIGHYYFFLERI